MCKKTKIRVCSKSSVRPMMVWHRLANDAASNAMNLVKRQFNRNANNGIRGDSMCRVSTADRWACMWACHSVTYSDESNATYTDFIHIYIVDVWISNCSTFRVDVCMQRKSEVIFLISSFVLSSTFISFDVTLPMRPKSSYLTSMQLQNNVDAINFNVWNSKQSIILDLVWIDRVKDPDIDFDRCEEMPDLPKRTNSFTWIEVASKWSIEAIEKKTFKLRFQFEYVNMNAAKTLFHIRCTYTKYPHKGVLYVGTI